MRLLIAFLLLTLPALAKLTELELGKRRSLSITEGTQTRHRVGPFLVDGVGIGSTVEEARQALGPRHVFGVNPRPWVGLPNSDLSNMLNPLVRMHYRDGRVVVCSGNRLDFCGRELLRRGQSVKRLDQLLGASDLNPYAGAGYGPDETVNKRLYFRWGYVVEALISNDVFIRAHYTPVEQRLLCGKIWRFRLWPQDQIF